MLPHWNEVDLVHDGITTHYLRTGGNKPSFIYVHGFSGSGLCYLSVARAMEEHFDMIFPDVRGHGHSQGVQPGEKTDLTEELAGFIRTLCMDQKPILGGASMGASLSAEAEARYPDIARALILEDPAWFQREPREKSSQTTVKSGQNAYSQWLLEIKQWSVEQVMDHGRASRPSWTEPELRAWAETVKRFDANFLTIEDHHLYEFPEVVKRLKVPTLLLTGDREKGAIVGEEMAEDASKMNPHIRVEVIHGAGHNVRDDNYPAFMEAIRRFIAGL